jgi:hypothetical protein
MMEEGARGLIANHSELKVERRARGDGRARPVSRSTLASTEKGKGARGGRRSADRWGRRVSGTEKKKKKAGS